MKKTLKCSVTEWNGMQVTEMFLEELWQSVPIAPTFAGKAFFNPLKADIAANGMQFPLLVVPCKYSQLQQQKQRFGNKILEIPQGLQPNNIVYAVWGGSNRLQIAKELEYEAVDCVLYDEGDFRKAHADQGLLRKPYQGIYYGKQPTQNLKVNTKPRV